ncbi:MAG: class B sortase [Oscillospiraceae bacterium]|nr:class B sortase [Oscillospiraceae bacterium]
MKESNKELISIVKRVVIAILLCVMMFSIAKIVTYFDQKAASDQMQNDIINKHVTPSDPVVPEDEEPITEPIDTSDGSAPSEDEEPVEDETPAAPAVSQAPVSTGGSAVQYTDGSDGVKVDFASLTAKYPDVVGYIYGPDTKIQYPIAYDSTTNDYYLNRDLDGNLNVNGSIFIEHLNEPDFSDHNTILYGHHMKSGLMFAGLVKYKDPSYYNSHPYFYIYTPRQNYRLDLYAGFVCAHDDEVFATALTQSQLQSMAAKSTFNSVIGTPTGNVVTLCTCSYEFNDARYVMVGELVPIS